MDNESRYLLQLIDCNCNDCIHLTRDFDKLNLHRQQYQGTGLMDNLQFGDCNKKQVAVSFIPNVCQLETQQCFQHRKNL